MKEIIQIASEVGTPLALGGLMAALFFFVVLKVISPKFLPQVAQEHGAKLILQIVNGFFVLSLVAMILGFAGWVLSKTLETHASQGVPQIVYSHYGISDEKFEALVSERAVTKVALERFFRDLGETTVPSDRLSEKLEGFIQKYKELQTRINASPVATPAEMELKRQGIAAVQRGDLGTAEDISKRLSPPTNLRIIVTP